MNLPNGAKAILDARKRGFRPDEMLIISMVGPTGEQNHHVYANQNAEYDWRWLVGLDACIYVKPGINWKRTAMDAARSNPNWLGIYDMDRFEGASVCALPVLEDIDKPKSRWRWRLDFLPWTSWQNESFAWGD